jgi:hypothetical protein
VNGNGHAEEEPRKDVIQSLTVIANDPTTIHRIGKAMGDLAARLWAEGEQKILSLSVNYVIDTGEEEEVS